MSGYQGEKASASLVRMYRPHLHTQAAAEPGAALLGETADADGANVEGGGSR